ncbi:lipid-binding SYLF domain-containing protein [Paraburkholderia bannensis]|uniref:Lipid-binding SYLF domain-containing protein n=1 Tax=Paraburkholderia bannensis TaxID=765414 RepID=A0A7W9U2A7_9BURK|nr:MULTISPECIES: YSC84-related protein [Paraburkholderia]MBB3260194.1 lipid-binding SYLF domain-containing protein [Paraburkholderia sp. WP4_3_2]MBB6105006.1 lipid-binding SYLF domain-containing protein [Paraburkholderia bannensis]
MNRRQFLAAGAAGVVTFTGLAACTMTPTTAGSSEENLHARREIDASVDGALTRLYSTVKGSRELLSKARAVLVFPEVIGAGIGVGGQYGKGALRAGGRSVGYFSTTAGSLGFQLGAQSRAVFYAFMTQGAYDRFRNSSGWAAGADGTVALVKMGANGTIDTTTAVNPIEAIVLTNAGLMAGVSLEGSKVSRLDI